MRKELWRAKRLSRGCVWIVSGGEKFGALRQRAICEHFVEPLTDRTVQSRRFWIENNSQGALREHRQPERGCAPVGKSAAGSTKNIPGAPDPRGVADVYLVQRR